MPAVKDTPLFQAAFQESESELVTKSPLLRYKYKRVINYELKQSKQRVALFELKLGLILTSITRA